MTKDFDAELTELQQRVSALEGDNAYLVREIRAVQRDVLGLQNRLPEHVQRLEERIGRVDQRIEKVDGRIGAMASAVDQLRTDMPAIIGEALRGSRGGS